MKPEILSSTPETLFSLGPEVVPIPGTEIALAYGAWGEDLDNNQLIDKFAFDLLIATASLPPCLDFPERIAERAGLRGTNLVKSFINRLSPTQWCSPCDYQQENSHRLEKNRR